MKLKAGDLICSHCTDLNLPFDFYHIVLSIEKSKEGKYYVHKYEIDTMETHVDYYECLSEFEIKNKYFSRRIIMHCKRNKD